MLGRFQVAFPVADHVGCVQNARTRLWNNSQLGITGNYTLPKKGYLKNEFQVACHLQGVGCVRSARTRL